MKLNNYEPLGRPDVAKLASEGRIVDAEFRAVTLNKANGFVLIVSFLDGEKSKQGLMYKQDDTPRLFTTPEALMSNARKLGIRKYSVDASLWEAQHYRTYDAQVQSHRRKRQTETDD